MHSCTEKVEACAHLARSCRNQCDDEWRQDRSDVLAHHEVGHIVELRRLAIDDHEPRAVPFGDQWKSGGRPDDQRRPDRQEQIAVERELLGTAHLALGHRLPERNGRGLDISTAVRAIGRATRLRRMNALLHPRQFVPRRTRGTARSCCCRAARSTSSAEIPEP